MLYFLRSLIMLSFLLTSGVTFAQVPVGVLDNRNRLETEIQENLNALIATRLEKSTFHVAVRVQVKEIPPPKNKDQEKGADELPAGMGVGLIDVRELVSRYEKQIEEMKLLKEEYQSKQEPQFQALKIEVIVGLDESTYDEAYVQQFRTWLKKRIRVDYGTLGNADAHRFKLKEVIKEPLKDGASTEPLSMTEELKKLLLKGLIPIASAIFLVFGLIALGMLVRSGLKENGTGKKDLVIEPKGEWALKNIQSPEFVENEEEPAALAEPMTRLTPRDLEHILGKIAFVCLELGNKVNELVRVWVDSGENGYIKAALLIDSMMAAREKIMNSTGALPAMRIPLDEDIASSQEESLAEAYRQASQMDDFDRLAKLEEIYWDLISVKTLGLQSLRRPFDFLQSLNQESLAEVLEQQKEENKALALMYLPEDTKKTYLNSIEDSEKEKVILQMLIKSQISQKMIWDVDTSLKVTLINQSAQAQEKLVNLFPRTIEVLETLDTLSEIRMLLNIAPSLPDGGLILKQQYTTLAFIADWKPEYVRRLVKSCTGQEVVRLIRTLPAAQEVILSACTDKIRMIVTDDLQLADQEDALNITKVLSGIKNKWLKIVASENIPMTKVLQVSARGEMRHAS
ncbi:MAG: hypothetical protein HUU57_13945 [Bdellovibrio sp.]|nr:hypothetical protein [Bdellovibrio sp.]